MTVASVRTALAAPEPRRRPVRYLATRKATKARCGHCKATVLIGLAEGLTARVDPAPIETAVAEVDAHMERRWTFTLATNGELIQRDSHRIAAGLLSGPIHAEHRCAVVIVRKGR